MGIGFAEDLLVCVALGVDMVSFSSDAEATIPDINYRPGGLCLSDTNGAFRRRLDIQGPAKPPPEEARKRLRTDRP